MNINKRNDSYKLKKKNKVKIKMTLEQTKKEIEELYKKRNELLDKRSYYREKLKNYKDLQYRSECPCCEQKTNREYFKRKIPTIEKKSEEVKEELDPIVKKIIQLNKIVVKAKDEEHKKHRKETDDYIKQNRNQLNKAIRNYNKGIEIYLPNISDIEKKIWNKAMEYHLDSKNIDENDELYFEIK